MTLIFLIVIAVVLPLLAWKGRQQMRRFIEAPRAAVYGQALVLQLILGALAVFAARSEGVPVAGWFDGAASPLHFVAAAALLAGAIVAMRFGLESVDPVQRHVFRLLAPVTTGQKIAWVGLCAVVALAEELAYRGVLFEILLGWMGNHAAAIGAGAVLFGLAHLLQGWKGFAVTTIFAIPLQWLCVATGGITLAVAIHFVYDVIAGLVIATLVRNPPPATTDDGPLVEGGSEAVESGIDDATL